MTREFQSAPGGEAGGDVDAVPAIRALRKVSIRPRR